jgi:hypothetical protein
MRQAMMTFRVQRRQCPTCIYRKDSRLDLAKLENDVRDAYGGFKGHRVCHHSKDVCCRGFWNRHKWAFAAGQIAQRLNMVEFVEVDTLTDSAPARPARRSRPSKASPRP